MSVPSPVFLIFAAFAAIVFNLGSAYAWRRWVLLAVNLFFIASFSHAPLSLLPFSAFLLLGYAAYRMTRDHGSRPIGFWAFLTAIVVAFVWLKRYTFLPSSSFLPFPYLLVGLSYVFFRVLHVVIDGYQGAIDEPIDAHSYLNYTLNFASFVSGPIQRFEDYRDCELRPFALGIRQIGAAIERVAIGYFKVAILSAALLLWQHQVINGLPDAVSLWDRSWSGLLIIAIYPVYLYFNFSGYVDVVIGVARFFGITLPENFNRPFSSENFIGFWGRWHMTLSEWLKTYVYNPLMQVSMQRFPSPALAPYLAVVAFFATFFLVGLWHGQTSEFLFFGVLQGGGVAVNKLYQVKMAHWLGRQGYRALAAEPLYVMLCRGLTFTFFAFSLLWFWSNWGEIEHMFGVLGAAGAACACLAGIGIASFVLDVMARIRTGVLAVTWGGGTVPREPVVNSRYIRTAQVTAAILVTVAASVLLSAPAPEIVYKAF